MIEKYKHIIWDWNGTLFEDVQLCCGIMNNMLNKRSMKQITVDYYREIFTFPVKEYYQKLGLDVSDANWEILSHEFINNYETEKNKYKLYEDAVRVLEFIRDKGIDQSVLSAYSQNTLEEMISHFGLTDYFVRLIGLDNIYAESKLANGIKWMKELGHEKGEVLLIGDTVHDWEVANEIGADCLLVSSGHQAKDKLSGVSSYVIDSINMITEDYK